LPGNSQFHRLAMLESRSAAFCSAAQSFSLIYSF